MDINQFVANFATQFDETDVTVFSSDTNFRSIEEWSSLTALSIMAMVDTEYGVKLTGDEIRGAQTISDLFGIVNAKK